MDWIESRRWRLGWAIPRLRRWKLSAREVDPGGAALGRDFELGGLTRNDSERSASGPAGASTTYVWDDHRLFQVFRPGVSPYQAQYRHDNKLISRQQTGRTLIWDPYSANGGDILLQRDSNPVTTMVYSWGAAPGQIARQVGKTTGGSNTTYEYSLPEDALGSVQSWGSTGGRFVRDAWGNVLSGSTNENHFTWLGGHGYWRENTPQLTYVRERWYDPAIGQWLSVDPVTTEPRYLYVRNQATTEVDPSGQAPAQAPPKNLWDLFLQSFKKTFGRWPQFYDEDGKSRLSFDPKHIKVNLDFFRPFILEIFTFATPHYRNFRSNKCPVFIRKFLPDPDVVPTDFAPKYGWAKLPTKVRLQKINHAWASHMAHWLEQFAEGALEGGLQELFSCITDPTGVIGLLGLLKSDWSQFEKAGLTLKNLWVNFVHEPYEKTLDFLRAAVNVSPRLLGSLLGGLLTNLLLTVVIGILTAGAGAALKGSKIGIKVAELLGKAGQAGDGVVRAVLTSTSNKLRPLANRLKEVGVETEKLSVRVLKRYRHLTPEEEASILRRLKGLTGIEWLARKRALKYMGHEVRNVHYLGPEFVSESTLREMVKEGFSPTILVDGRRQQIIHHHHRQQPDIYIELPRSRHFQGNKAQHPYPNQKGKGLPAEYRELHNDVFRKSYWSARARDELSRRGLEVEFDDF